MSMAEREAYWHERPEWVARNDFSRRRDREPLPPHPRFPWIFGPEHRPPKAPEMKA